MGTRKGHDATNGWEVGSSGLAGERGDLGATTTHTRKEDAMEKVMAVATIVSVAFFSSGAAMAEPQSACPPEVTKAKEMLAQKNVAVKSQDIQAPRSLAGARQEVQAPRGQEVQAPRGQEVQAPRGQEVQAARTQQQAPRGQEVQAQRTVAGPQ